MAMLGLFLSEKNPLHAAVGNLIPPVGIGLILVYYLRRLLFKRRTFAIAGGKVGCGGCAQHIASTSETHHATIRSYSRRVVGSSLARRNEYRKEASTCVINMFPLRQRPTYGVEKRVFIGIALRGRISNIPGLLHGR